RVRRPRQVRGVVDVQRVDPDERRSRLDEDIDGVRGEKRVRAEVRLSSPVPREVRAHEDRLTREHDAAKDVRADRATRTRRVDDDHAEMREALERKFGEICAGGIPVMRRTNRSFVQLLKASCEMTAYDNIKGKIYDAQIGSTIALVNGFNVNTKK